jgi:flagellar assembly factor FliW
MNTVETVERESHVMESERIVHLPLGLLGFERIKHYALIENPHEAPFRWLQVLDNPGLAFLLLPATEFFPDYEPDVSAEDIEFLQISTPDDAWLFGIVTLGGKNRGTVNLKGPIVINRHSLVAKQVVLANAARYSLQEPLPVGP